MVSPDDCLFYCSDCKRYLYWMEYLTHASSGECKVQSSSQTEEQTVDEKESG